MNISAFWPVLTTGLTVEETFAKVKDAASSLRNVVSPESQTKIDTFLEKFSIGDCRATCEAVEKLSGGFIKFLKTPPKRNFNVKVTHSDVLVVSAVSAEEAVAAVRAANPGATISVA